MKKIIVKALVATGLTVLMGTQMGFRLWEYFFFGVVMFFLVSWFGFFYERLYSAFILVRCVLAFVGTVVVLLLPVEFWEMILPDNGFRTFLQAITLLGICVIPVIYDWKNE